LKELHLAHKIPAAIPVFNLHETLPQHVLRDHFDEVELPDIDLYNYYDVSLASKNFHFIYISLIEFVPVTSPIHKIYAANI
jgi:hypothetical protein